VKTSGKLSIWGQEMDAFLGIVARSPMIPGIWLETNWFPERGRKRRGFRKEAGRFLPSRKGSISLCLWKFEAKDLIIFGILGLKTLWFSEFLTPWWEKILSLWRESLI